jgi:hypothetical protein
VQKVVSQKSASLCTRCIRANTFPVFFIITLEICLSFWRQNFKPSSTNFGAKTQSSFMAANAAFWA